jgi:hypothetical protein
MASLSTDKNGNHAIQFKAADGQRRTIRLGKFPLRAVREVKSKVESLNASRIAGISDDPEVSRWLGELSPIIFDKLSAVGLVPPRENQQQRTLESFITAYLAKRTDLKSGRFGISTP